MPGAYHCGQRFFSTTRPVLLVLIATALFTGLFTGGCGRAPKTEAKEPPIGWQPSGSWSGHGNRQTDSFEMDSGLWRIKWETRNENPPGKGMFKVIVHSAVSGRPLMQAVEHRGAGRDIAYVAEDPRLYFLVIESTNLDWTVAVEESVTGEARIGRPAASWSFASYLHPRRQFRRLSGSGRAMETPLPRSQSAEGRLNARYSPE